MAQVLRGTPYPPQYLSGVTFPRRCSLIGPQAHAHGWMLRLKDMEVPYATVLAKDWGRRPQPRAVEPFKRRAVYSIRDYSYKLCYAAY